jgi:tetratricopeptide (TPR) repeat protein
VAATTTQEVAGRTVPPPARAIVAMPLAARILVAGAVGIILLAAASLALAPSGPVLVPERVLVVPFENRTGNPELDALGAMAADWVTHGLVETGLVEVVTSNTMLAAWGYVAVQTRRPHGANLYRSLAEETGAGTLVSGNFYLHGDSIHYQSLVTDAANGRLLRTMEPAAGAADAPLDALVVLRTRVMGALATLFDPRLAMTTASASRPPTYESYRAYLEGTERFIRGDYADAIPHYERAAALDSTYAQARIFAAICLHNTGSLERADSVARTLNGQRQRLSPFDRYLLDWVLAWNRGDRVGALAAIRSATEVVPGSEWLYVRGFTAMQANRPAESVESLLKLDPERGFMRGFMGYWADLGASLHALEEYRRELRTAQRARRQYPQDIIALRAEVRALAALGRVPEVERRLEESMILPMKYGTDPGAMIRIAASELRAHGYPGAAAEVIDGAIAWYNHRPAEERRGTGQRAGLGQALYLAERWEQARAVFEELAAEQPANLDHLGHLGAIAARQGDPAEVQRIDALLARTDPAFLHGAHTYWRARIAAAAGDRERAVQLLRESFAQGRPFAVTLHAEMDFEPLRDHPVYRELLRAKG